MPQGLGLGPLLDYWGVVPLCGVLFVAFMREWIVPGPRYRRLEKDRDRWEKAALDAIQASRTAMVPAAEAISSLVSHLPDPGAKTDPGDGSP